MSTMTDNGPSYMRSTMSHNLKAGLITDKTVRRASVNKTLNGQIARPILI